MKSIATKSKEDFNNTLKDDVFSLLSINGAYNIVGSASLKGIYYNSDIDLNEKTKINGLHPLENTYDIFLRKFKIAKANKNIYITDFKCGINDTTNEPIKWTYKKLIKEKQLFINCLQSKSTIKLDIIYLLNGIYVEITEVYFLELGTFKTYEESILTAKHILSELKKSYDECCEEKLYFKALKRLNSILNLQHKSTDKLTAFFNSESGILYKAYSDLHILLTLIRNQFRKPPIETIKNNLQIIKQNLAIQSETKLNVSKLIDDICKKKKITEMYIYIDKVAQYLSKLFNRDAKVLIDKMVYKIAN